MVGTCGFIADDKGERRGSLRSRHRQGTPRGGQEGLEREGA